MFYFWKQAALLIKKSSKASFLISYKVRLFSDTLSQSKAIKLIVASTHVALKGLISEFPMCIWTCPHNGAFSES